MARLIEIIWVAITVLNVLGASHSCYCNRIEAGFCSGMLCGGGSCRCWSCEAVERERTLAMIKPDGLSGNYTEKIKEAILESGFDIVEEAVVQLDAERASLFYAEHADRSFFNSLVKYMTSGPVRAMVLEGPDAISRWRILIGPTDARKAKTSHPDSIRAMCGLDSEKNCVHGSDSLQSAAREISFFFGDDKSEALEHDEL